MSTRKIGDIGEKIIEPWLKKQGWLVYPAPDERHPIDWFLATKDKRNICLADAKTKPQRAKYPDTGIPLRHYEEYKYLQEKYNLDVRLIFADSKRREIYGETLKYLSEPETVNGILYPKVEFNIIYFPLSRMEQIGIMSIAQAAIINNLSRRNEAYYENFDPEKTMIVQPTFSNFKAPSLKIKQKIYHYDNPIFLKKLLLDYTCKCGQQALGPNLHDDYCEYKKILLNMKG